MVSELTAVASRHRLAVGDQGQRLQQRPAVAARLLLPQPADPGRQFGAHLEAIATRGLAQFPGTIGTVRGNGIERAAQLHHIGLLQRIEQRLQLGDVEWPSRRQQGTFDDLAQEFSFARHRQLSR